MSEKVRVALIGAGGMANGVHYPSLAEFDDVEMVGLCDLVGEKLSKTADRFGIEARYTEYRQMLEETQPDAVYILMPPHHLYDLVIDCLERGLNVFIEKPPGITTHQMHWMAEFAAKNGVIGMVGFNRRYIPLVNACRDRVLAHSRPMHQVVSTFYKWTDAEMHPYYRGAVDILTSDAVHAVDTIRYLAGGEVVKVASSVRSLGMKYEVSFNALVEFDNGCLGVLLSNWRSGARVHQFEMHAAGIAALCHPNYDAAIHADGEEFVERLDSKEVAGSDEYHKFYGFYDQSRHFIDCVKSGQEPSSSFPDAVKTMQLVDMIYRDRM